MRDCGALNPCWARHSDLPNVLLFTLEINAVEAGMVEYVFSLGTKGRVSSEPARRCADSALSIEQGLCLSGCKSGGRVNGATADDGTQEAGLGELRGGDFGEVVREDNKIGVLALFQFTLLPFLELRVSRA